MLPKLGRNPVFKKEGEVADGRKSPAHSAGRQEGQLVRVPPHWAPCPSYSVSPVMPSASSDALALQIKPASDTRQFSGVLQVSLCAVSPTSPGLRCSVLLLPTPASLLSACRPSAAPWPGVPAALPPPLLSVGHTSEFSAVAPAGSQENRDLPDSAYKM